jgi:hypothetical protein
LRSVTGPSSTGESTRPGGGGGGADPVVCACTNPTEPSATNAPKVNLNMIGFSIIPAVHHLCRHHRLHLTERDSVQKVCHRPGSYRATPMAAAFFTEGTIAELMGHRALAKRAKSRLVASAAAAGERPAIQRPSAVSAVRCLNLSRSNDLRRRRKTRLSAATAPFSAASAPRRRADAPFATIFGIDPISRRCGSTRVMKSGSRRAMLSYSGSRLTLAQRGKARRSTRQRTNDDGQWTKS